MKKIALVFLFALCSVCHCFSQIKQPAIRMISELSSKDPDVRDLLAFEGIDYYKIRFIGGEMMKSKSFHLTVREIWNGKVISDTTVFNSKDIGIKSFETVNDTVLYMRVMGKHDSDSTLRLTFSFPRFSITKDYKALNSDEYSLRNVAEESKLDVGYDNKFYLLTYILPYEREDGSKSWCAVGSSGKDIENWGKKFGVKHYLVFEMKFN
jgi:hypothetical protein